MSSQPEDEELFPPHQAYPARGRRRGRGLGGVVPGLRRAVDVVARGVAGIRSSRARRRSRRDPRASRGRRDPSPSTVARTARRRILALRVFGSAVVKRISAGANALPSSSAQRARRRVRSSSPGSLPARSTQKHQTTSPLTSCGHADRAGLGHGRVADERRLVLGRPDALAGDVQGVVGAAVQEPVAVGVDRGPVAVRPDAGKRRQ